MSGGLTPPPTRAANGEFAWVSWYNQLYTFLSTSGSVSWSLINKAGSSIGDLVSKGHSLLTGVQGGTPTEQYHLTAAQNTNVVALPAASTIAGIAFKTKSGIPTTGDIAAGNWAIYKDTSGGTIKLYANDGGTIKAVALV